MHKKHIYTNEKCWLGCWALYYVIQTYARVSIFVLPGYLELLSGMVASFPLHVVLLSTGSLAPMP